MTKNRMITDLIRAALVIATTPATRAFLEREDPKALEQLDKAIAETRSSATHARNMRRLSFLERQIDDQRAWIMNCGEDLEGYVARYGRAIDPDHLGNGGEAIYQADINELQRLQDARRQLVDQVFDD